MALHSVPQAVFWVIIKIEWTDILLNNHVELHVHRHFHSAHTLTNTTRHGFGGVPAKISLQY